MIEWTILHFIHDLLFVLPVAAVITALFVGAVLKFDIEPFKAWLYRED